MIVRSLASLLLLVLSVQAEQICPDGYLYESFFNKCYYFSNDTASFERAEGFCASRGGHLVAIHDSVENAFVASYTQTRTMSWIGINLLNSPKWTWIGGEAVNFTHFAGTTPGFGYSQCGVINGADSGWAAEYCYNNNTYVCQVKPYTERPNPTGETVTSSSPATMSSASTKPSSGATNSPILSQTTPKTTTSPSMPPSVTTTSPSRPTLVTTSDSSKPTLVTTTSPSKPTSVTTDTSKPTFVTTTSPSRPTVVTTISPSMPTLVTTTSPLKTTLMLTTSSKASTTTSATSTIAPPRTTEATNTHTCDNLYCSDGYVMFAENCQCYKYNNQSVNYDDAEYICKLHNTGSVAKIDSSSLNGFLQSLADAFSHPYFGLQCSGNTSDSCYWQDGTKLSGYSNFGNAHIYVSFCFMYQTTGEWFCINYGMVGSPDSTSTFFCQTSPQTKSSPSEPPAAGGSEPAFETGISLTLRNVSTTTPPNCDNFYCNADLTMFLGNCQCYSWHYIPATYPDAEKACNASKHGKLAIIDSAPLNSFLMSLVNAQYAHYPYFGLHCKGDCLYESQCAIECYWQDGTMLSGYSNFNSTGDMQMANCYMDSSTSQWQCKEYGGYGGPDSSSTYFCQSSPTSRDGQDDLTTTTLKTTTITPPDCGDLYCDGDFTIFLGNCQCYSWSYIPATYPDAEKACERTKKGTLAKIDSSALNSFLMSLVRTQHTDYPYFGLHCKGDCLYLYQCTIECYWQDGTMLSGYSNFNSTADMKMASCYMNSSTGQWQCKEYGGYGGPGSSSTYFCQSSPRKIGDWNDDN